MLAAALVLGVGIGSLTGCPEPSAPSQPDTPREAPSPKRYVFVAASHVPALPMPWRERAAAWIDDSGGEQAGSRRCSRSMPLDAGAGPSTWECGPPTGISTFDLSAYLGSPTLQVRLVFGSNGSGELGGWYIDSVEILGTDV